MSAARDTTRPGETTMPTRAAGLLAAILLMLCGCRDPQPRLVAGGDPERGGELIRAYGCPSCHLIPGIEGADGLVGPPLVHWRDRVYIAGRVANTPENLVRWIMDPQAIDERTAMPDMGIGERDARDVAAYLFSIR